MKKGLIGIILLFTLVLAVDAAKLNWVLLGKKTVSLAADRDQVHVTGWSGEFKGIQIRVKETGVHFLDVSVVFGNGRVFDVPLKSFIAVGQSSRIIDLPGKDRVIKKVVFVYQTKVGATDKALVEVWGIR